MYWIYLIFGVEIFFFFLVYDWRVGYKLNINSVCINIVCDGLYLGVNYIKELIVFGILKIKDFYLIDVYMICK